MVSDLCVVEMEIYKSTKNKRSFRSRICLVSVAVLAIAFFCVYLSAVSGYGLSLPSMASYRFAVAGWGERRESDAYEHKYLYWGDRIDCPGKHCDSCEGLGHQESSLRCALEEAMILQRLALGTLIHFLHVHQFFCSGFFVVFLCVLAVVFLLFDHLSSDLCEKNQFD